MRRMRRRCSRCLRTSKPTSSRPERIFELDVALAVSAGPCVGSDRLEPMPGWRAVRRCRRRRNAGGKHPRLAAPRYRWRSARPPTITQKIRSPRPSRRKALISSFTQRDRLALGEQITTRLAEARSALLIVSPRSVVADRSLRSRNTGASRLERMPNAVSFQSGAGERGNPPARTEATSPNARPHGCS